ncbi:MAG: hypothetical protein ABJA98_01590 [Acidobacteriota bacterium]
MTRQQMADGLEAVVDRLANGQDEPPAGVSVHEWAYVKGIASAAILRLKDSLGRSGPWPPLP